MFTTGLRVLLYNLTIVARFAIYNLRTARWIRGHKPIGARIGTVKVGYGILINLVFGADTRTLARPLPQTEGIT